MMPPSIFDYVKQEEAAFETGEIKVGDNWNWNFRKHVQLIFHLKNGVFFTGDNDWLRVFKNIMEPILSLSYWTEDIEVKDIFFFIEESADRVLSFLLKKYHDEVFVREHNVDTFIDEITESDLDYGGVLVQDGVDMPEVLKLKRIGFCDQTNMLGGPVFFKYSFAPTALRAMSKAGWGEEKNGANVSLDELIMLATADKQSNTMGQTQNKVVGKNIDVYVGRGDMPQAYLKDNDNMEDYRYQLQVVALYINKDSQKEGVILYRKEADPEDLMFFTSNPVEDRALGRGVGETLLHPQIWTNFLEIHKMAMLEAGSKIVPYTDDETFTQTNNISEIDNMEVLKLQEGRKFGLIPTVSPANIQLYSGEINSLYEFAQALGQANDPIMGKEAASGTTFRGQERSVAQGRGSHDRRRGKRAKFIEEIYRKLIIPRMVKEVTNGKKFVATLSSEELTWVIDQLAVRETNRRIIDMVLNKGKQPTKEEQDTLNQIIREDLLKKGNKHLLEILKGEFKDVADRIGINIANKQKNIADLSDKFLSVIQSFMANPQGFQLAMGIPALAKAMESVFEYGGISIADFSTMLQTPKMPVQAPQATPTASPVPSPVTPSLTPTQ